MSAGEVWVRRTLEDLRAGDRCRMGGVTARVVSRSRASWNLVPDPNASSVEWGWRNPVKAPHWEICVWLRFDGGEVKGYQLPDLSIPVEIAVTEEELVAIERLGGWSNRFSSYFDRQSVEA